MVIRTSQLLILHAAHHRVGQISSMTLSGELVGWLEEVHTDPILLVIIQTFLLGRGELSAISLPSDAPRAYELVSRQLCLLGFDNLVEGRIPSVLVDFQREYSLSADTQWTAERWASGLVQRLLSLTHRQWLYRNAMVHYKGSDGYTRAEHERIIMKLQDFIWVDPEDLLPQDRGLLDEDFDELGSSPAAGAMWIEAMETAISAAEHSRRSNSDMDKRRRRLTYGPHFVPKAVAVVPVKDSEGSIKYKRRRRKVR